MISMLMKDSETKIKNTLEDLIPIQSDTGTPLEKDIE